MFNGARGINPYFFIGIVVDKNDPIGEGRVRVMCFGVHPTETSTNVQDMLNVVEREDLPWATCINGTFGAIQTIPDEGEWVFGFFVDGRDAQHPMLLGTIPGTNTEDWTSQLNQNPNPTPVASEGPAITSTAAPVTTTDPNTIGPQ